MATKATNRGRPAGSPNREVDIVEAPASRCSKCQSTRRTAYQPNPIRKEIAGIDPVSGPYTAIVWRRTTCADCGQARIDRQHVNEPA
jgi:hypothetical protein